MECGQGLFFFMGFMDGIGSGKVRKIVYESSAATETYLARQIPDKANALATPVGLIIFLLVFDWRLGLLSLLPVAAALVREVAASCV